MSKSMLTFKGYAVIVISAASLLSALRADGATCESLSQLNLPKATITAAERVAGGAFTPPGGKPIENLPTFCRVAATLAPTTDSNIRIEVWMPESGWNSRFEGTGNGGFAGAISYGSLAGGLRQGYAVANTDMGMAPPPHSDASAFIGHAERWADWGYRSTHEMTVVAKRIVEAYYQKDPNYSYFVGCSTGGEQALMEAQRFPNDYDGILGGGAANNRTGVHTSILWNYMTTESAPAAYIPPAKLSLLASAVMAACDAADGLKDGLISDPRRCHFDPASIECPGADTDSCLTPAQVNTARLIYKGPVNPRTKEQIYPGVPLGSEMDWVHFGPPPGKSEPPPYNALFKWVFSADWDWHTFDYDRSFAAVNAKLGASVNATSPDLGAFHAAGHKLLVYHGWADWLVVPGEAINYRNAVLAWQQRRAPARPPSTVRQETDEFYRLFMVPGMGHCGGGPGLAHFDGLAPLMNWVEHGAAPDQIPATRYVHGKPAEGVAIERPVCAYPHVAKYRRSGSTDDPANFVCVDSDSK